MKGIITEQVIMCKVVVFSRSYTSMVLPTKECVKLRKITLIQCRCELVIPE